MKVGVQWIFWWWAIALGVLFLAILNLIEGEKIGDGVLGIIFAIGIFLIAAWIDYYWKEENSKSQHFLAWLSENRTSLLSGYSIEYNGVQLTQNTQVSRFQATVSLLLPWPWYVTVPSRFFALGENGRLRTALLCSSITILLGWESFIWAPIAIISLIRNALGGGKVVVSELLAVREGPDATNAA